MISIGELLKRICLIAGIGSVIILMSANARGTTEDDFHYEEIPANNTRIVLSASGPLRYKHSQKNHPHRLELQFSSRNAFADIEKETLVSDRLVKKVRANFYKKREGEESPPLKTLTFYLREKTPYSITTEENAVVIEIQAPFDQFSDRFSLAKAEKNEIVTAPSMGERERTFINAFIEGELQLRKQGDRFQVSQGELLPNPLRQKAMDTVVEIDRFLKEAVEKTDAPVKEKENKPSALIERDAGRSEGKKEVLVDSSAPMHKKTDKTTSTVLMPITIGILLLSVLAGKDHMAQFIKQKALFASQVHTDVIEETMKKSLIVQFDPHCAASEAYRTLRTNILSIKRKKNLKTLLVTSALSSEGKTTVTCNLAVTLAEAGSRVLLVDSALRNPMVHKVFDLNLDPGLTDILTNRLNWTELVHSTDIKNLSVITSGKMPFNPSETLSSPDMKQIIEGFNSKFDIVLFDSTDLMGVTDSIVLASMLDGVLLVVQTRKTQRETILQAQSLLENGRARIIGSLLTNVKTNIPQWFDRYLDLIQPAM